MLRNSVKSVDFLLQQDQPYRNKRVCMSFGSDITGNAVAVRRLISSTCIVNACNVMIRDMIWYIENNTIFLLAI